METSNSSACLHQISVSTRAGNNANNSHNNNKAANNNDADSAGNKMDVSTSDNLEGTPTTFLNSKTTTTNSVSVRTTATPTKHIMETSQDDILDIKPTYSDTLLVIGSGN